MYSINKRISVSNWFIISVHKFVYDICLLQTTQRTKQCSQENYKNIKFQLYETINNKTRNKTGVNEAKTKEKGLSNIDFPCSLVVIYLKNEI